MTADEGRAGGAASDPATVAAAVRAACLAELEALKPGNVGLHGDGHGMRVDDFVRSAEVSAGPLADAGWGVGQRIYRAVAATRAAVGCNTNLGIVLLAAPLCHAAQHGPAGAALRTRLERTLAGLDLADARAAFAAIRLAAPAGLGRRDAYDVTAEPEITLREAMATAAADDRIARQYANDYRDIYELGLVTWRRLRSAGLGPAWATSGVYLRYLSGFDDSHIRRKYGPGPAGRVRRRAETVWRMFAAEPVPERLRPRLLAFDRELKQQGINPGTSADLTVATLLADSLERSCQAAGTIP